MVQAVSVNRSPGFFAKNSAAFPLTIQDQATVAAASSQTKTSAANEKLAQEIFQATQKSILEHIAYDERFKSYAQDRADIDKAGDFTISVVFKSTGDEHYLLLKDISVVRPPGYGGPSTFPAKGAIKFTNFKISRVCDKWNSTHTYDDEMYRSETYDSDKVVEIPVGKIKLSRQDLEKIWARKDPPITDEYTKFRHARDQEIKKDLLNDPAYKEQRAQNPNSEVFVQLCRKNDQFKIESAAFVPPAGKPKFFSLSRPYTYEARQDEEDNFLVGLPMPIRTASQPVTPNRGDIGADVNVAIFAKVLNDKDRLIGEFARSPRVRQLFEGDPDLKELPVDASLREFMGKRYLLLQTPSKSSSNFSLQGDRDGAGGATSDFIFRYYEVDKDGNVTSPARLPYEEQTLQLRNCDNCPFLVSLLNYADERAAAKGFANVTRQDIAEVKQAWQKMADAIAGNAKLADEIRATENAREALSPEALNAHPEGLPLKGSLAEDSGKKYWLVTAPRIPRGDKRYQFKLSSNGIMQGRGPDKYFWIYAVDDKGNTSSLSRQDNAIVALNVVRLTEEKEFAKLR